MSSSTRQGTDTSARLFGTSNNNDTSGRQTGAQSGTTVRITVADGKDTRNYTIVTYTGKGWYAGTDANVFVTLYGSEGKSEDLALDKSQEHNDPFEANQKDTFKVKSKDIGYIYKINIRHDNTGRFPGWLLNKVVITDDENKKNYTFSYYDWLFKNNLHHEIECDALPVIGLDHMIDVNAADHHTDKFEIENTLIVRRGQTFKLQVELAREYDTGDSFYFTMNTGKRPRATDKSHVTIQECLPKNFNQLKEDEKWGYTIRKSDDPKKVLVEVFVPANALPAKYQLVVDTDDETVIEASFPVYILFNPWCPEDEVFMEDEAERREYILKQNGQVYVGHWSNPRARKWYFGQFEEVSLAAAFSLLEGAKAQGRDSAVEVSRIVSSKVNSCDNNGVLEGNWSGDYEGGKRPTAWASTPAILEYFVGDLCSVKYGQCWVFSAVVTTVMRALGIPCRSVTNFSSAHDSDGNCSNDRYFDEEGEPIEGKTGDSVWNFHVWNDAWMARKDLPVGYGGWQAIDATPQEKSQGLFQMGPASLRAIKEGDIKLKYDTGFVLAEVNADTIYWQKQKDGSFEAVKRNRTTVGRNISTKSVGSDDRNDITDMYKFPEGSVLERGSVRNALVKVGNKAVKTTRKDIEMELISVKDTVKVGEDVKLIIKLRNTSTEHLKGKLVVTGRIVRYDSAATARLAKFEEAVSIKGLAGDDIPITIKASTYLQSLEDDSMLRFLGTLSIKGTGQIEVCEDIVDIEKPSLMIMMGKRGWLAGREESFTVCFQNPLAKALTQCELYVDGSVITNRISEILRHVPGKEKFEHKVLLTPAPIKGDSAKKSVIVSFSCKELGGLQGNVKVTVGKGSN